MAGFIAVYDACVLHPAPLRDLLLRLALTDLFRARWTEEIHAEWVRSVLERRPDLKPEQLQRTLSLTGFWRSTQMSLWGISSICLRARYARRFGTKGSLLSGRPGR